MPRSLSPEQEKAVFTFLHHKDNLHRLLHNASRLAPNGELLPSNFVAASFKPLTKCILPRGPNWCWNQSNAKVTIKLDQKTTVTIRKVSTRKRFGDEKPPSFKLWLYHIHTQPEQYFLWSEKGASQSLVVHKGFDTAIGTIFPQELSIESLSFLSPFVDEETARELGWAANEAQ